MRKIVVLKGVPNTGKTSTLRKLALCIKEKYKKPYKVIEGKLNHGDFIVIFETNNKQIAIVSMGDSKKLAKKLEKVFENNNIDMIYCASRSRGITIKIVKEIAKKHQLDIIFTSTYINKANKDELNKIRAKELFNIIEENFSI